MRQWKANWLGEILTVHLKTNLQNDDFYHEAQAIENNQNDTANLKIQDIFPS